MQKEIEVSVSDYIEGLQYEVNTRKDVIAYMLSNNMKTDTDAFRKYQKELIEFDVQYEAAKKELENREVKPLLKEGQQVNWNLDFYTHTLTIEGID